jgi:uncharacterized protein (UPF0262 family)
MTAASEQSRIIEIHLDQTYQPRLSAESEHERSIAIFDLIEENFFKLLSTAGPYILTLRIDARHIHFEVKDNASQLLANFMLAMGPLRRVMRDYNMICESYYEAIRTKTPSQIQAIDMGRRALHDEGSEILQTRLDGKIEMDKGTARRLFSLVFVLKQGA